MQTPSHYALGNINTGHYLFEAKEVKDKFKSSPAVYVLAHIREYPYVPVIIYVDETDDLASDIRHYKHWLCAAVDYYCNAILVYYEDDELTRTEMVHELEEIHEPACA